MKGAGARLRSLNNRWRNGGYVRDPDFGYKVKGGLSTSYVDYIIGTPYTCPSAGIAQSITVYVSLVLAGADTLVKCAIYKVSDNSLVGYTEEKLITEGTDDWVTFNIIWGGTLEADTAYYLVWWKGPAGPVYMYYDTDLDGCYDSEAYNGFPDPFSPTTWANHKFSIYCTYSAVAPPARRVFMDGFSCLVY